MSEKTMVTLDFRSGPLRVPAIVVGCLAVHRAWYDVDGRPRYRRGFRISHVPTGAGLGLIDFRTQRRALEVAAEVDRLYGRDLRRLKSSDGFVFKGRPWYERVRNGLCAIMDREMKAIRAAERAAERAALAKRKRQQ